MKDLPTWAKWTIGIGAVLVVAALVVFIVSTHVVAMGVAFGVGVAASCVGSGVGVWAIVTMEQRRKQYEMINKVKERLTTMMKQSQAAEALISNMDGTRMKMKKGIKYCENMRRMESALKKIKKYLKQYQEEGQEVQQMLKKECERLCQ